MAEEFTGIEEIRQEVGTNKFVDLHVTCTELWPVGSDYLAQVGHLSDGTQSEIKFMSYTTSDVRELEQGESYVIHEAMTISDDQEGRAILLKAGSNIETAKSPRGGSPPSGPECPDCGDKMPVNAYHEDGNAPEIGWEYWHCPHCNHKMRPEAIQ